MENKTDLRVIKTRNAIKKAFKEMICEMEPADITVKELSERAMIHRKTFYLHYSSIEVLFEEMARDSIESYNEVMLKIPPDVRVSEANKMLLDHITRQEPYVERMFCASEYDSIVDRLVLEVIERDNKMNEMFRGYTDEEMNLINTFTCQSALGMFRRWEKDGKVVPAERMLELASMMMMRGMGSLVKHSSEYESMGEGQNQN